MPRIVGSRLREARKRAGLSQSELGRRVGTASTQICMLEGEKCTASLRNAALIAAVLQVSTDFLVGYGDDPRRTPDVIHELELARRQNGQHEAAASQGTQDHDDVAILEVDAAAGAGALTGGEHIIGHMRFGREWLRTRNLVADRCRLIRVRGESMQPTLPDKASIMIDLSRNKRRNGKILVIRRGDELIVKRTVEHGSGWQLASDNPDKELWPDVAWPDDAAVVGQVCWVGRTLI